MMNDKYRPYVKNDFKKYYYETDNGKFYTYKIIRQLTEEEKNINEFEQYTSNNPGIEEMYEIELSNGEIYHVFDEEILKECELSSDKWHRGLMNLVDSLEYDEDMIDTFVKECKIEKFIEKYM